MSGGLTFKIAGKMSCGASGAGWTARAGPESYDEALELAPAWPTGFIWRPTRGAVFVSGDGLAGGDELESRASRGLKLASFLSL